MCARELFFLREGKTRVSWSYAGLTVVASLEPRWHQKAEIYTLYKGW